VPISDTLTLDGQSGADDVYLLRSRTANGAIRIRSGSTLYAPTLMRIEHSTVGSNPVVDKTYVQFQETVEDSSGKTYQQAAALTLTRPRAPGAVGAETYANLVANLIDFLMDGTLTGYATHANLDNLLIGNS